MTPSCALHLSLLGGFRLSCGAEPVPLRRPAQRLLAYLAVHRARPVGRAALAERLWEEADRSRASASLRTALSRLPRPRGQELVTAGGGSLALAPSVAVDLDVGRTRALALAGPEGEGSADAVDDPLDGPGGWGALERDLLPGWDEDWLLVEQETYRQLRLHALEVLSVRLCSSGRHALALLAALAALRSEPLRETAHARLIEVHLAEGNPVEALRQYQTYRRLLADQLGLAPSPAIRGLVRPVLGRPIDREL